VPCSPASDMIMPPYFSGKSIWNVVFRGPVAGLPLVSCRLSASLSASSLQYRYLIRHLSCTCMPRRWGTGRSYGTMGAYYVLAVRVYFSHIREHPVFGVQERVRTPIPDLAGPVGIGLVAGIPGQAAGNWNSPPLEATFLSAYREFLG
jgi:hypothetical protein